MLNLWLILRMLQGGGKGRGGEELLLVRLFPTPSDLQEFFSTLTGISIFAFTP